MSANTKSQPKWLNLKGLHNLLILVEQWKRDAEADIGSLGYPPVQYLLALRVISQILDIATGSKDEGFKWVRKHLIPSGRKKQNTAHFRPYFETQEDFYVHASRAVELAELLYNLQTVRGITDIYKRIHSDPKGIEGTIAELDGLRLLWLAGLPFSIYNVNPKGKKYEYRVTLPNGETAYCETKCKVESNAVFSTSSVATTISHAITKLPKNKCGILIMKVPNQWVADAGICKQLVSEAKTQMRNSTRLCEVLLYCQNLFIGPKGNIGALVTMELLNESSPYTAILEGGLIQDRLPTQSIKGLDVLMTDNGWLPFSLLTSDRLQKIMEAGLKEKGYPNQSDSHSKTGS